MHTEEDKTTFLKPEDLVQMGLYQDTGHIFRAIKTRGNVPPHIRISKKNIRFPFHEFQKWLRKQMTDHAILEEIMCRGGNDVRQ